MFFDIIMVFLVVFFTRRFFFFIYKDFPLGDTYFHYYYYKEIRENNVPTHYPRMVKGLEITYPYFPHKLLSYFKIDREFFYYSLNSFVDAVFSTVMYIVISYSFSANIALNACLLYALTPQMFSVQSIGPRAATFTPRLISEISICILLFFTYWYDMDASVIAYFLVLISLIFILMSSQFSIQFLAIVWVPFVIFWEQYELLFLLASSVFMAHFMSKGVSTQIMKNMLVRYKWYIESLREGGISTSRRSLLSGLMKAIRNRSLKDLYREVFHFNPLLILVTKNPMFILVFWLLATESSNESFTGFFFSIFVICFIVFILTSTKYFLFLGEAERYISHITPFIALVFVLNFGESNAMLYILVYGVVYLSFECIIGRYLVMNTSLTRDSKLTIDFLMKLKSSPLNVACSPIHLGGWRILAETPHNFLSHFNSIFNNEGEFSSYETLDLSIIQDTVDKLNIHVLILESESIVELSTHQRIELSDTVVAYVDNSIEVL